MKNKFKLTHIIAKHNSVHEIQTLGVQVRNMKMDFNTGGTWRQVKQ